LGEANVTFGLRLLLALLEDDDVNGLLNHCHTTIIFTSEKKRWTKETRG